MSQVLNGPPETLFRREILGVSPIFFDEDYFGRFRMIEEIVDIDRNGIGMETFLCRPERNGPFPPVIMLMDAPGIREELYEM